MCDLSYDLDVLTQTAASIRQRITQATDPSSTYLREVISLANARDDISELCTLNIDFDKDTFITTWTNLPCQNADLGLGLGPAEWARKVSGSQYGHGCVILPRNDREGTWEVLVMWAEGTVEQMLIDKEFLEHVCRIA